MGKIFLLFPHHRYTFTSCKKTIMEGHSTSSLLNRIGIVGRENKSSPQLSDVEIFTHYFDSDKNLRTHELGMIDGNCTRRELLARYLFLNSVLDQGPDMIGVRKLLVQTINELYRKEIRLLHNPIQFFNELGFIITTVDDTHEIIKKLRSETWAHNNNSNPNKYNLFMDNSTQTLNYLIFRWGVPLSVPMILQKENRERTEPFLDYIENEEMDWRSSSEIMSWKIKDHKRLGMGKAIGDKAAHLFAKWIVYTYPIGRRLNERPWGQYSFEVLFDSNAGRVLFRTGYFLTFTTRQDLIEHGVVQENQGKGGKDYIRVTNIRGMKASINLDLVNSESYSNLCVEHLLTHKRQPQKYEIQKIPLAQILEKNLVTAGELDDGLMFIGTNYCFNHESPSCQNCPIKLFCQGYTSNCTSSKQFSPKRFNSICVVYQS